jgi:hypothetical protein
MRDFCSLKIKIPKKVKASWSLGRKIGFPGLLLRLMTFPVDYLPLADDTTF